MLGSSHENQEDIAVINEVIWSPLFTLELAQSLFGGFVNLITHSEDDTSCQLVTAYHKGMPLGKYLTSRPLPFRNRVNLCYEFLKAMVSYTDFPPWVQDILIDEDQIIVRDDQLHYNELLILKTSDPETAAKTNFIRVKKKVHKIIESLIGQAEDITPAMVTFMGNIKSNNPAYGSLQGIYDEFQKVYLYDYYLNKEDTTSKHPAVAVVPIPIDPVPVPDSPQEDPSDPEEWLSLPALSQEPSEEVIEQVLPDNGEEAAALLSESQMPMDSVEPEDLPISEVPEPVDPTDADMEKNLELFFNRDRQQSEAADDRDEDEGKKGLTWLWLTLGVIGIGLLVWSLATFLLPTGKPTASFTPTQQDTVWQLKNTSQFSSKAPFKRAEWTVYQNGKLIDLYDSYDLTLNLEDPGTYQVVLRVMDDSGVWSKPYKDILKNQMTLTDSTPAESTESTGITPQGDEKMDQFTLKYNEDRVQKDTAYFRSGTYSLQILPGKKPEIIEIQGVMIDKSGMVSLWISSENTDPVTLSFTGYNQGKKTFTKDFTHNPINAHQWEMFQFTIESTKVVNGITIAIRTNSLINLDDLNIDSYK